MDQSGKTNLPFATADGKPIDPATSDTPPNDFVKNATSEAQKGGDQRNVIADRKQIDPNDPNRPQQPPTPQWLANRPQQAGSPLQRVNPESVPKGPTGGTSLPPPTTQQPKGAGSIGNARPPFKGMK